MCVCVYLYDAQCVVQVFADFLFLLLLFLLAFGRILEAIIVNAEAEEDLHGAKVVVEVAETHLIETWTDAQQVRKTKHTVFNSIFIYKYKFKLLSHFCATTSQREILPFLLQYSLSDNFSYFKIQDIYTKKMICYKLNHNNSLFKYSWNKPGTEH